MSKKRWEVVDDRTWRSLSDPQYTVEIGVYDDEETGKNSYFTYPALNGRGIPGSPHIVEFPGGRGLSEAKSVARQIMRQYSGADLKGFEWRDLQEPMRGKVLYGISPKASKRKSRAKSGGASIGGVR